MRKNNCRWLDRYFGDVCRNTTTHPSVFKMSDGTCMHVEPCCRRCKGCGYEPTTPTTPAWDAEPTN